MNANFGSTSDFKEDLMENVKKENEPVKKLFGDYKLCHSLNVAIISAFNLNFVAKLPKRNNGVFPTISVIEL